MTGDSGVRVTGGTMSVCPVSCSQLVASQGPDLLCTSVKRVFPEVGVKRVLVLNA